MSDIAAQIWLAHGRSEEWSVTSASLVAWNVSTALGLRRNWDPEAGESWILFAREAGGQPLAMLCTSIPLAVSRDELGVDWPYPVVAATVVGAWEDELLSIQAGGDLITDALPGLRDLVQHSGMSFSPSDLWFFTV